METNILIFGVFRKNKLIIPFGMPVNVTYSFAEWFVTFVETGLQSTLQPGDYVAYDYAENHNINP